MATLQPGDVINAKVERVEAYGVWLSWNEVRMLVLIPDVAAEPVGHPSERVRVGETLAVQIVLYSERDEAYRGTLIGVENPA